MTSGMRVIAGACFRPLTLLLPRWGEEKLGGLSRRGEGGVRKSGHFVQGNLSS